MPIEKKTLVPGAAAFAAVLAAIIAPSAQAHVVVQPAQAQAGAETTLRFVVGHGCDEAPTTALRVELPPGVALVRAEAKPGWTIGVEPGGSPSVTWRGELAPHQPEGFEVAVRLPASPGRIAFPAAQSCGAETVRWDEPAAAEGQPKSRRPAPSLTLVAADAPAQADAGAATPPPSDVQVLNGAFADRAGRPLYTFNFDTMVGMSHCEGDCAAMWPPLIASKDARPDGDWSLVRREDGSQQWAYRTKPLYTYSKDRPGGPPTGLAAPNWKLAK
jgi:predicted lipoprotein with Yx(FWY)xxD motif